MEQLCRLRPLRIGGLVLGVVGCEVLANGSAGEMLAYQAGQEQQRGPGPVVRDDLLCLAGRVAGNQDDVAELLTADLRGVVLEEAVLAVGTGEVEPLTLIE